MTREQAIRSIERHMDAHRMGEYPHVFIKEALDMAIAALRAQKEPVKLDRSRWEGCGLCKDAKNIFGNDVTAFLGLSEDGKLGLYRESDEEIIDFDFCPICSKPLTEGGWAEQERRIGGNDGSTDLF